MLEALHIAFSSKKKIKEQRNKQKKRKIITITNDGFSSDQHRGKKKERKIWEKKVQELFLSRRERNFKN